jgi:hypothetical protein
MLSFIAEQLTLEPASFGDYAERDQTRREHLAEIQAAADPINGLRHGGLACVNFRFVSSPQRSSLGQVRKFRLSQAGSSSLAVSNPKCNIRRVHQTVVFRTDAVTRKFSIASSIKKPI